MSQRLSPSPVFQLLDEGGDTIISINSDGSTTLPTSTSAPATTPNGAGAIPQITKVVLTAAQLKALKATPLDVIPAPGAGKCIQIEYVTLRIAFGTTAYTLNAGTLKLFYGAVATAKVALADQASLLTAAASGSVLAIPGVAIGTAASPLTDAQALNVSIKAANDGAAEYTLGDGILTMVIAYQVINLSV